MGEGRGGGCDCLLRRWDKRRKSEGEGDREISGRRAASHVVRPAGLGASEIRRRHYNAPCAVIARANDLTSNYHTVGRRLRKSTWLRLPVNCPPLTARISPALVANPGLTPRSNDRKRVREGERGREGDLTVFNPRLRGRVMSHLDTQLDKRPQ